MVAVNEKRGDRPKPIAAWWTETPDLTFAGSKDVRRV
jgi:hypothetical protein